MSTIISAVSAAATTALTDSTPAIRLAAGPIALTLSGPEIDGLTLAELADVAEHTRRVSDRWLAGHGRPAPSTTATVVVDGHLFPVQADAAAVTR